MNKLLCVGLGGFFGALSRYLSLLLAARLFGSRSFPFGTLIVNLFGCFLIGFGLGLVTGRDLISQETRLLLFTGFLGSYTTYSTFAYESFALARDGGFIASAVNIIAHVLLGLAAVRAGDFMSNLA